MNNEDKILSILESLQKGQAETNQRLDKVDSRLDKVEKELSDVKHRTTKIELTLEQDIARNIKVLAEGHTGIVDRLRGLEDLPERVEDIQATVDVLKYVFKEHSHA